MKIYHIEFNKRFILTNDKLEVGDKVFPVGQGWANGKEFIFNSFEYADYSTGFPNEPHTILDLKHNGGSYKPYEIRTDMGFGPRESYFKIIKEEPLPAKW